MPPNATEPLPILDVSWTAQHMVLDGGVCIRPSPIPGFVDLVRLEPDPRFAEVSTLDGKPLALLKKAR